MSTITTVLFDFDGTIANTLPRIIEIVNHHAESFGYKKVTEKDLERYRGKTPKELLTELHVSLLKLPFFIYKMQVELFKEMNDVYIFPGITKMLETLKQYDLNLAIISSNSQKNIESFLRKNRIAEYFNFIHSERNLFGKDSAIRIILKGHGLKKEEVVYVGDEIRDIDACKKVGITCISVAWGFNTFELLQKNCKYVIQKPEELVGAIEEISSLPKTELSSVPQEGIEPS